MCSRLFGCAACRSLRRGVQSTRRGSAATGWPSSSATARRATDAMTMHSAWCSRTLQQLSSRNSGGSCLQPRRWNRRMVAAPFLKATRWSEAGPPNLHTPGPALPSRAGTPWHWRARRTSRWFKASGSDWIKGGEALGASPAMRGGSAPSLLEAALQLWVPIACGYWACALPEYGLSD